MDPVVIKVGYLVRAGGNLPAGTEGQIVGYGPGGIPVAVEAPAGGTSFKTINGAEITGTGNIAIPAGNSAQVLAFEASDTVGYNDAVIDNAENPLVLVVRYAEP